MTNNDYMTVGLTGNCSLHHPLSVHKDEAFLKIVDLLRGCDASFTNLETAIQDGEDWPAFASGMGWSGSYYGAPPMIVDELKWLGFNGVWAANNHVVDFGENGILTTSKYLREGGMPFAGIGAGRTEAYQPCYIETGKGRIAIISTADWGPRAKQDLPFPWPFGFMPDDGGPGYPSRPGLSLLRYDTEFHVDQPFFDELHRVSEKFDWQRAKIARSAGGGQKSQPLMGPTMLGWEKDTETDFFFMGRKFVLDKEFKITTFSYLEDLDRLYWHIRAAHQLADVVVVSLHDQSHGPGVYDYIDDFAHGAIDAGADIYVNTGGIHRGIEIYKNKAILYGQPGFDHQNTQMTRVPHTAFERLGLTHDHTVGDFLTFRGELQPKATAASGMPSHFDVNKGSAVHVAVFDENADLRELRVYPMDARETTETGRQDGLPRLAEAGSAVASKIFDRTIETSKQYGTKVQMEDGVGVIKVK